MKMYVEITVPDGSDQSDIACELDGAHEYLSDPTVWTLENLKLDIADGVLDAVAKAHAEEKAQAHDLPTLCTPEDVLRIRAAVAPCPVNSPDGYECDGTAGHELPHFVQIEPEDDMDSGRREWLDLEAK